MVARTLVTAAGLLALLAAPAGAAERWERALEARGLVRVTDAAPDVRLNITYAQRDNHHGRRLPGYCAEEAWLLRPAAEAVRRAQRRLRAAGLGLRIYDAYRPARATRWLVREAFRSGNGWLVRQGYIARRSNHNRGAAVDITLVDVGTGRELDMGSSLNAAGQRAHTENARGRALRNRRRLVRALERAGWRNYAREWWHFDYPPGLGRPLLDVSLGCSR